MSPKQRHKFRKRMHIYIIFYKDALLIFFSVVCVCYNIFCHIMRCLKSVDFVSVKMVIFCSVSPVSVSASPPHTHILHADILLLWTDLLYKHCTDEDDLPV